jgi:Uma2 family endonuclease
MTATLTAPTLSQEDWLRFEAEAGVELVHGQIVEKPMSMQSARCGATMIRLLGNEAYKTKSVDVFDQSMGYRCFADDPMHFRRPDVSVMRIERMKGIDPQEGFMPIPPDLAVEVLSPGDLAYEVAEKIEEYLKNRFPLVWIVQPNVRTVSIHRADGSVSLLHENDEITGESALPAFKCKVAEFFAADGPRNDKRK